MNKTEVMKQLKAVGTAQNRKLYGRHLTTAKVYGVSYANIGKLQRQIKVDQELAEKLWATGVHEAQVLATMVADPVKMAARTLDAWAKEADNRGTAGALSNLVAKTPVAWKRMEKWTKSKAEWLGCTGWHVLASLARDDETISDKSLEQCLKTIEDDIHGAKNWTKYAMNNALISIGIRNPKLRKKAIAAAKRIGKVEVDHGDTSCKTPDAAPYIAKAAAYGAKKKAAQNKPAKKKATAGAR